MTERIVAGRYRIDSQIGIGGMGIVYRAHDTKLRRDVALKVIAPHLVEDQSARERFMREAQALAGLSHPNIVTVYDLAEDPQTSDVFIVMELLNGVSLRRHITNPSRPGVYDMAIQVCRALECAHGHGILHRDIKPENIFVCTDGTVKLMDFGLARLVDASNATQAGMVTGTVAYMAPEQLKGGALDGRTDLYAFGVLLYEYLCGFTPFASESPATILLKHLTEPPPSLRLKVPSVSPELEALILRLLAKDAGGRYPSATILRDILERLRAGALDPRSAGAADGASIPLVVPKQKGPPSGSRPLRPTRRVPASLWKFAVALGLVALGVYTAFAYGGALQRLLIKTPEKKNTTIAKAGSIKGRKSAGRAGKRSHLHNPAAANSSPAPSAFEDRAAPRHASGSPAKKARGAVTEGDGAKSPNETSPDAPVENSGSDSEPKGTPEPNG